MPPARRPGLRRLSVTRSSTPLNFEILVDWVVSGVSARKDLSTSRKERRLGPSVQENLASAQFPFRRQFPRQLRQPAWMRLEGRNPLSRQKAGT